MPDATIQTMKYYATVTPPGRAPKVVAISLPYIAAIAGEPHYSPPKAVEHELPQERGRGPNLRKLVDRALGRGARSRAWGATADEIAFQATLKRIAKTRR
jgi:hypothetical protein